MRLPAQFAHEIAKLMSAQIGIDPQYIDVYPEGPGWGASLNALAPTSSVEKQVAVRNFVREFQGIYSLRGPGIDEQPAPLVRYLNACSRDGQAPTDRGVVGVIS